MCSARSQILCDNLAISSPTHISTLLCPWRGFTIAINLPRQSYQVAVFKPAAPLVYNSTPAFSPRKYTRTGIGYGLHPRKSSPPSSSSDRSVSWWISQTRWPPKSCVGVNMVFVIVVVKGFVRGLGCWREGRRSEQLIIYMLMGRHHILYSARRLNPSVCFLTYLCVCVCDQGWVQGEGRSFWKWHVPQWFSFVQGKFSNCGNDVITLCHNRACVMCYLPCQARISQMEIRGENCH